MSEPKQAGRDTTTRLAELAALPDNWDSYGAPRITPEALAGARELITSLHVVPCSSGGVQVEYHNHGHDVVIEIGPDGKALPGEAAPRSRSVLCIYCGESLAQGDPTPENVQAAYDAAKRHDAECPRNPLVARIKELEAAPQGLREALAYRLAVDSYLNNDIRERVLRDFDVALAAVPGAPRESPREDALPLVERCELALRVGWIETTLTAGDARDILAVLPVPEDRAPDGPWRIRPMADDRGRG
jgi:hypothetical protein